MGIVMHVNMLIIGSYVYFGCNMTYLIASLNYWCDTKLYVVVYFKYLMLSYIIVHRNTCFKFYWSGGEVNNYLTYTAFCKHSIAITLSCTSSYHTAQ